MQGLDKVFLPHGHTTESILIVKLLMMCKVADTYSLMVLAEFRNKH